MMYAQNPKVPAFPGAEGFGKYVTGGREGKVVFVENLNDNGPGSLRAALAVSGPRIILFKVSGNIELESNLYISEGDVTIAGQSAPGEGITLQNYPIKVQADNVIIRFIRSRLGDLHDVEDDAISVIGRKNIIIDHCSFSWATDECGSFYDNEYFTLQYCIISESLNKSVHSKGDHGYGGIWGGKGASFLYNVLAHHNSRNPRFNGSRYHKNPDLEIADFRNNIIYNWQGNSAYGGERGNYNMVNNYFKPGPATSSNKDRILEPYKPYGKFYLQGNVVEGFSEASDDNALGVHAIEPSEFLVQKPFPFRDAVTFSANEIYENIMYYAGQSLAVDAVDQRILKEIKEGSAQFGKGGFGIIDSQEDVGSWPILKNGDPERDSDADGIPDFWEIKMGLNPNDPSDGNGYDLNENYTNIEVFLNALVQHLYPNVKENPSSQKILLWQH